MAMRMGVATANDNGHGNHHAIAVAMAKARGMAMILMTFYAISVLFLLRQLQFSAKFKCFSTPIEFRKSKNRKIDSILCFCMFARLIFDGFLYRRPDSHLSYLEMSQKYGP